MGAYFDDLAAHGKAIKAILRRGLPHLAARRHGVGLYLCSKEQLDRGRARGEDAGQLAGIYAKTINTALKSKPADMTITTHVCRGNFRST
jgi:5-methyltetrahydropteroyltriglutamate--homocysteine methyltransferase